MIDVRLESDPDKRPCLWLLYAPEQDQKKDPNMYLWIRRCRLFKSSYALMKSFEQLNIRIDRVDTHNTEFPELVTLIDDRGFRWYACRAPIE